ncbi:MAG: DUF6883 domain-containing protein [Actinomycetota bacterium]
MALTADVKSMVLFGYGTKYVLEGMLNTPIGRQIRVETIWVIEIESDRPRLVTAYPA